MSRQRLPPTAWSAAAPTDRVYAAIVPAGAIILLTTKARGTQWPHLDSWNTP